MKKSLILIIALATFLIGCTSSTTISDNQSSDKCDPSLTADCKYTYEDAEWELDKTSTEFFSLYKGTATLTGWIVYVPFYVGEPEAHFHIAKESLEKLPPAIQNHENYKLKQSVNGDFKDIPEEIISKLEKYNEQTPATITVNNIIVRMEGNPSLNLISIK